MRPFTNGSRALRPRFLSLRVKTRPCQCERGASAEVACRIVWAEVHATTLHTVFTYCAPPPSSRFSLTPLSQSGGISGIIPCETIRAGFPEKGTYESLAYFRLGHRPGLPSGSGGDIIRTSRNVS